MAKRGWMLVSLRNYYNLFVVIGIFTFAGACSGGAGNFDNARNELIGKNIDIFVLGPGYYYHPIAKRVMYIGGKKSKVARETKDDVVYERRIYSCVYELVVDKKTRLLKSWHFVHEDRRYCNAK